MQLCNPFVCVCLPSDGFQCRKKRNVKISLLKNPPWFVSENNGVCELPPRGLHSVVMGPQPTKSQPSYYYLAPLQMRCCFCVRFRASCAAEVIGRRSGGEG